MQEVSRIKKGDKKDPVNITYPQSKLNAISNANKSAIEEKNYRIPEKDNIYTRTLRINGKDREKSLHDYERYLISKNKLRYFVDQSTNEPKTVNSSRLDTNANIVTWDETMDCFSDRLLYYKDLISKQKYKNKPGTKKNGENVDLLKEDFDLEEYIKCRGPVIVAQEFFGCGARCTNDNSDLLTFNYPIKNYMNTEKNINFEEAKKLAKEAGINDEQKECDKWEILESNPAAGSILPSDDQIKKPKDEYYFKKKYKTKPLYDIYDDRITIIYNDKINNTNEHRMVIKEFYRANMNVSVKFKANLVNGSGSVKGDTAFDFIYGYFTLTNQRSLYLFQFDETKLIKAKNEFKDNKKYKETGLYKTDPENDNLNGIDIKANISAFIQGYKENNLSLASELPNYGNVTNPNEPEIVNPAIYRYLLSRGIHSLRETKSVTKKYKTNILIHKGDYKYTSSEGCLTIYSTDYTELLNLLEKNNLYGKFGIAFLFRNKLEDDFKLE